MEIKGVEGQNKKNYKPKEFIALNQKESQELDEDKLKEIFERDEKESEEFYNKLEEIRENVILEVAHWGGLKNGGHGGTIITKNKEVYSYQRYNMPKEIYPGNDNFIRKDKELDSNEYNKVIKFIEDEIVNKDFQDKQIFDAGFDVTINYNGIEKTVKNDNELYDKAKQLINELLK